MLHGACMSRKKAKVGVVVVAGAGVAGAAQAAVLT